MYDDTQLKIISATMKLVMEKGYASATTKDIAKDAGVNECTIFRKFKGKKEIVIAAMSLPEWNPMLREQDFHWVGDLEQDLCSFSEVYMSKATPKMVKVSMGLRIPELFDVTARGIMEVPKTFKKVLVNYFLEMQKDNKIHITDIESAAMQFLSMTFGFVFLSASFGNNLSSLDREQYIRNSVEVFVKGIM